MRLAKFLAHAGVASRRGAEEIIRNGRVQVAGETVIDPARDVDADSGVSVDGRFLEGIEERMVFVVNKPPGVLSTARDTHGRRTVIDLVPARGARLYPVGRLDADSTGIILVTNDGDLAQRMTHPSFEVPRVYRATVRPSPVPEHALRTLREGVDLDDGRTAPAKVRQIKPGVLELTIHEGRNHQVKRMCEAVGHRVRTLQRVRFGPLRLDDLPEGAHRRLKGAEVEGLRRAFDGAAREARAALSE
ncbi:MAG TPA: pseudouridine synthase [Solirubrobacteraceae bacterium]|nr:pseudouridine synthase [Solirubrobacteraceae bacterium]